MAPSARSLTECKLPIGIQIILSTTQQGHCDVNKLGFAGLIAVLMIDEYEKLSRDCTDHSEVFTPEWSGLDVGSEA